MIGPPLVTIMEGEGRIEAEVGMTETGSMTEEDLVVMIGIMNAGGDNNGTRIDQEKNIISYVMNEIVVNKLHTFTSAL